MSEIWGIIGQMVTLKSHKAFGSFLGRGTHVWLEIESGRGTKITFSGANVQRKLRVAENLIKDFDKPSTRGSVVIPAPAGVSESEWAQRVVEAGREVKKSLQKKLKYSGFFPSLPGYGNCCTVVLDIVQRAGGEIPVFRPEGFAPGLRK